MDKLEHIHKKLGVSIDALTGALSDDEKKHVTAMSHAMYETMSWRQLELLARYLRFAAASKLEEEE